MTLPTGLLTTLAGVAAANNDVAQPLLGLAVALFAAQVFRDLRRQGLL